MAQFKVQTFNAGLLKVFGADIVPHVDERIEKICEELINFPADIIFFQEIFENNHFAKVQKALYHFPYHIKSKAKNFLKSPGLSVFSKFPILENSFERFSDQQDIENFSNHGFQKVKIQIVDKKIDFYNIHLTAGGLTGNLETKRSSKIANKQLLQLFKNLIDPENTILIGDFNCGPRTDIDTYNSMHEKKFYDVMKDVNLDDYLTWDNKNTIVAKQKFDMPNDRIDHLFLHNNSNFKVTDFSINLNKTFPILPFNLSDHFGVLFTVEI